MADRGQASRILNKNFVTLFWRLHFGT